ncbi:MAG: hypothetical protein P8N76_00285 [Pirellulaceae bacterium]|nr:hypothetical protein [Pirellulaceae bacterium]
MLSGSFDNLHEFLDEPTQATDHPTTSETEATGPANHTSEEAEATSQRWRNQDSSSELPEESFAEAAATVETAQPVQPSTEKNESNETDQLAETVPSQQANRHSYVIVIGGCILGLTAALGLAGFMLSQPAADGGVKPAITNGSQATAITETDQPTSQEPSIPDPSDDTANRLSNDESTTVTAPDIEKRPTSEPKTSSEDTPIEQPSPALVVEQEQQESESSPTTLPNEPQDNQQIDLADDDLASFARWLQSPDSTEQFPPPVPTQPKPKPNVAEQKTVLVKPLQPTRPIPNKVDVASRLEDPIIAVEFKSVSLANALRTISNYSTIPITIDPNGLGRRNLTANKPVDLLIRNESTVGQVLTKLLGELHLGYFVVDGQLIVTTAKSSQGKLTQLNHRVGDLCDNNPESMAAFSQWLQKFVEYGSWASQGGEGKCQVDGTTLVIEHDDTVQYQILLLCERLRLARGSIAQSRIRPEFVELTPKRDLLRASQRPITLRVWRDANLDAIAASIEDQADIKLLVDWYALHLAGWSPRDQMKFFCQDLPLKEALAKLLQPMGLTYRILDNATLQITSLEAISTDMDVEFYPLPAGESYEELSEKIVRKIGPAQFQPTGRGSINFDVKSNSLIVSLPQPDQAIVQATIAP